MNSPRPREAPLPIARHDLLQAVLDGRQIHRVQIKQIDFAPGQRSGLHRHSCPVVGYIARGTIRFQREDGPVQRLPAGSAFYEPPDTRSPHFDNASEQEPARFIALYLLSRPDQELIEMLV